MTETNCNEDDDEKTCYDSTQKEMMKEIDNAVPEDNIWYQQNMNKLTFRKVHIQSPLCSPIYSITFFPWVL